MMPWWPTEILYFLERATGTHQLVTQFGTATIQKIPLNSTV